MVLMNSNLPKGLNIKTKIRLNNNIDLFEQCSDRGFYPIEIFNHNQL